MNEDKSTDDHRPLADRPPPDSRYGLLKKVGRLGLYVL